MNLSRNFQITCYTIPANVMSWDYLVFLSYNNADGRLNVKWEKFPVTISSVNFHCNLQSYNWAIWIGSFELMLQLSYYVVSMWQAIICLNKLLAIMTDKQSRIKLETEISNKQGLLLTKIIVYFSVSSNLRTRRTDTRPWWVRSSS